MLQIKKHGFSTLLFEFIRYCIVGGAAFLCDYAVLFLLTEYIGIYYLVSAFLGFITGISVNYFLSIRWVFRASRVEGFQCFLFFLIIGAAGLGMTVIGMWLGVEVFGFNYMLVKAGVTGIVLLWNYTARRILLFREVNYEG